MSWVKEGVAKVQKSALKHVFHVIPAEAHWCPVKTMIQKSNIIRHSGWLSESRQSLENELQTGIHVSGNKI